MSSFSLFLSLSLTNLLQGRILGVSLSLVLFYLYCLWASARYLCEKESSASGDGMEMKNKIPGIDCLLRRRDTASTAGCSERPNCLPVLIGQVICSNLCLRNTTCMYIKLLFSLCCCTGRPPLLPPLLRFYHSLIFGIFSGYGCWIFCGLFWW